MAPIKRCNMAIKNRDGTLFKLTQPNPLMKDQSLWKKKFILHNCEWKPENLEDTQGHTALPLWAAPTIKETITKPEEPASIPVLEEVPAAPDDGRIRVWCLPAQVKEHVDKLYGGKFQRVKYGKKFMFEAIVMEEDDLYMVFWTNTRAVTEGSVVFPQNQDKRWWRVNEVVSKDGGYAIMAVACDFTPEFSSQQ
jgi:hypothetical protein